ncbi:MAG: hypothetical protein RJA04_1543 [Bacteroidota bacterium]
MVPCLLVGLSFIRTGQQTPSQNPANIAHNAFVVHINQTPMQGPRSHRTIVDVVAIRTGYGWLPCRTKSMLFVSLDGPALRVGQRFLVLDQLQAIRPPVLPEAFDWPSYYASQGIFYSNFIRRDKLILMQDAHESESFFVVLRKQATRYLHEALPAGVHRQVADAMFLGIGNGLDFETRQSYASLGAIHILSVSGMHIGLLYLGLQFLLGFIRKFRPWGGGVFFALMLIILWSYAAMTGFSAPVLRSAWMFSVMLFGQVFRLRLNPLNSWAFACFILLLVQPNELFQVGFQLSFTAVLGLILSQKRLLGLWTSRFWLFRQIWELTCVAISAQILAAPLIIFYFHQFPNPFYFFLLNPILVLLSSITLCLGFLYLILAPTGIVAFLGSMLLGSFELLHGVIFATTHSLITVIPFLRMRIHELAIIYICLGLFGYWWTFRSVPFLYAVFVLTGLMFIYRFQESLQRDAYLTKMEGEPIFLSVDGFKGSYYGRATPAWLQANVSGWWAKQQVVDTLGFAWPKGSFSWHYHGNEFVYLTKPSINKTHTPKSHLILSATIDLRDPRFLQSWQRSTWYFIRKPSNYRLNKLKEYWPQKVVYLSQQSAVYFP